MVTVPDCCHTINLVLHASDGMRFAAHAELLSTFSAGFPAGELVEGTEEVELPETGETIELLIQFMHHAIQSNMMQQ